MSSRSCLSSIESSVDAVESLANATEWIITNRGGFAQLAGLAMVPSQNLGPSQLTSEQLVDSLPQSQIKKLNFEVDENYLRGIIYYPSGWDRSNKSRCILYHNPNCITLSGYFENKNLTWTPKEIMQLRKCPIIFYDYRGTGLSKDNIISTSSMEMKFRPTYDSIAIDGVTLTQFAFNEFDHVEVWGSSLGGGVATVSLEKYLSTHKNDCSRVSFFNHDSFSTTPAVVMPNWKKTANFLGWVFGGNLDAQTSMIKLIDMKIPITILCHQRDPVIPAGSRMMECLQRFETSSNVRFIKSEFYGHADLSYDMIFALKN